VANICEYKVIVKGKKNACYAFMGSMSNFGGKEEDEWVPSKKDPTTGKLIFHGDCKWSVDSYCTPFDGKKPVELPEDFREAEQAGEDLYWYNTVQERSEMFQVEVQCNSADIEDYDPEYGPDQIYEHYKKGMQCKDCWGDPPKSLRITDDW